MSRQNDERRYRVSSQRTDGQGNPQTPRANWFFPFTPNKEQKADINAIKPEDGPHFESVIQKAVEAGYKFSVKWNVSRNAVQATCTGGEDGDLNPGKCLATYHIDTQKALLILVYALTTVFPYQEEWKKGQAGFDDSF